MASLAQAPEVQRLCNMVKTMTNAQLKNVLRGERLMVSGVKTALQIRIIEYIERLYQEGKNEVFDRLKKSIHSTVLGLAPGLSTPQPSPGRQYQPHPTPHTMTTQTRPSVSMPSNPLTPGRLSFKDCPFYTILEPLTPTAECKIREQTRDSVELRFALSDVTASRLQSNPNLRVMVYCAADTGINQYTKSDIAFPYQTELKANLDEVKANMRGLKNKPGTTRPADVTNYIRRRPGYQNLITMTYALTQKRFFVLVNLVQRRPVDQLVADLRARRTIPKEQVLREMKSRADDSDIVATASVMSLKCPLSTLRIDVPCRTLVCTHNQCFDASSFLQLQEQAPTWTCPVCSKATSFESLQVDQYVDGILRSTTSDVEQITVEPDGKWSNPKESVTAAANEFTPATDDNDELIEIGGLSTKPVKQEAASTDQILQRTPLHSGGTPGTSSPANHSSTNKRAAAQVIDLTGSDDDDDDDDDESPVRPAKRPALNEFDRSLHREDLRSSFSNSGLVSRRNYPLIYSASSGSSSHASGYDT